MGISGVTTLAGAGVAAGMALLIRGMRDYRSVLRVADTSTSRIASIAAGEVRVSGTVETAEMTLVSLLQSRPCVYYRAQISLAGDSATPHTGYTEERSIGFQVRDASGVIRVFPRGAKFDAQVAFEGETGLAGDEPPGLEIREGGATQLTELDRAMAAEALTEVHRPDDSMLSPWPTDQRGHHKYRETRLAPGDPVTIIGRALPFSDLDDPAGADLGQGSDPILDDPEIAADLDAARATGTLADDPAAAWGNAAIPGFGIGRPVVAPVIDPAANRLPLAGPEVAARIERTFSIAPEALVMAASDEVPPLIAYGIPGDVVERGQTRFIIGLLGAILAIASAMAFALSLGGGLGG
jgi:hypothetical protein